MDNKTCGIFLVWTVKVNKVLAPTANRYVDLGFYWDPVERRAKSPPATPTENT